MFGVFAGSDYLFAFKTNEMFICFPYADFKMEVVETHNGQS